MTESQIKIEKSKNFLLPYKKKKNKPLANQMKKLIRFFNLLFIDFKAHEGYNIGFPF